MKTRHNNINKHNNKCDNIIKTIHPTSDKNSAGAAANDYNP